MKIHAIQTGTVAITTKWREGVGHGRTPTRQHAPRPRVDRAASDLRLRHRAPRGCDRRRHRRDRPRLRARLLPALAAVLPLRRSRAGPARAGDRPAARAARDLAVRCPPGRHDPSAHRPRRRTAPLPRQRDPRLTGRARLRGGTAGARSRLSEQALAGLVQADSRRPAGRSVRPLPGEHGADGGGRRDAWSRSRGTAPASSPSSSRTATTPSFSPPTAPTPRTPCFAMSSMASAPMRPPSTSPTSASAPTRPRRRPSTCRRMIPRPGLVWRAPDTRRCAGEGDRVISFETSVRIERPIEEVFAFVSDPIQFPRWNSAVQAVRRTSARGETGEVGSTYSMERELPSGRVENGLEVFVREQPTEFGIRTTSGPTPFVYRLPIRLRRRGHDRPPRCQRRAAGCRSRARAARGARGQARRRRELRRPQAHARGERRNWRVERPVVTTQTATAPTRPIRSRHLRLLTAPAVAGSLSWRRG